MMRWLRRLLSYLHPPSWYDPLSDDYVGHMKAYHTGRAKCICTDGQAHISCPFHGR